ncbi:MAG: ribosomal-processing cysteine protease Prp, partial [Atopostipes suicloacalis]|nr:ribosomal-processing cysteine protease Prp [Atopostipes suicloacalis]
AEFIKKEKDINGFILSGHAESGPFGHDLVCAASSALSIGTANNLSRILSSSPEIKLNEKDGGYLELSLPKKLKSVEKEQAKILLESLYYSLIDVEKEHGQYITVKKLKNT